MSAAVVRPGRRWASAPAWERRLAPLPALELPGGLRVHEARGIAARRRGLGGLDDLPGDRALRLGCRAVHTFTMRFALDLIWLAADGTVVRVDRGVRPRRHRGCARARAVVETRAGFADRYIAAGVGGVYWDSLIDSFATQPRPS
jgi:uncharacterized membrane protein (UPF0127 family)